MERSLGSLPKVVGKRLSFRLFCLFCLDSDGPCSPPPINIKKNNNPLSHSVCRLFMGLLYFIEMLFFPFPFLLHLVWFRAEKYVYVDMWI